MTARIRVRIVGQVRPGEDVSVDLIRDIEDLDVGDSFRIGEDRVQIVRRRGASVTDNIHRELLEAVVKVPHHVAVMPSEIAADATTHRRSRPPPSSMR